MANRPYSPLGRHPHINSRGFLYRGCCIRLRDWYFDRCRCRLCDSNRACVRHDVSRCQQQHERCGLARRERPRRARGRRSCRSRPLEILPPSSLEIDLSMRTRCRASGPAHTLFNQLAALALRLQISHTYCPLHTHIPHIALFTGLVVRFHLPAGACLYICIIVWALEPSCVAFLFRCSSFAITSSPYTTYRSLSLV